MNWFKFQGLSLSTASLVITFVRISQRLLESHILLGLYHWCHWTCLRLNLLLKLKLERGGVLAHGSRSVNSYKEWASDKQYGNSLYTVCTQFAHSLHKMCIALNYFCLHLYSKLVFCTVVEKLILWHLYSKLVLWTFNLFKFAHRWHIICTQLHTFFT